MRKYCPSQQFSAFHLSLSALAYRHHRFPPPKNLSHFDAPQKQQKNAICAANLTMIAKNVEKPGAAAFGGGF